MLNVTDILHEPVAAAGMGHEEDVLRARAQLRARKAWRAHQGSHHGLRALPIPWAQGLWLRPTPSRDPCSPHVAVGRTLSTSPPHPGPSRLGLDPTLPEAARSVTPAPAVLPVALHTRRSLGVQSPRPAFLRQTPVHASRHSSAVSSSRKTSLRAVVLRSASRSLRGPREMLPLAVAVPLPGAAA